MRKITTHIVAVKANEVTETVWHKEEADTLLHHLLDITRQQTKLDKAGKDNTLSKNMALNPVNARCKLGKDSTGGLENDVVDGGLLLSEAAIYGEGYGNIGAVVLE